MAQAPLRIEVDLAPPAVADGLFVIVEPLYGAVAVAAALDSGWAEVEVAPEASAQPPIPLVSFEQRPPRERPSDRCRVRCDDLVAAAGEWVSAATSPVLLGSAVNARPLAAGLARAAAEQAAVRLVLAPAGHEPLAADAMWAAGMLVRILLEEVEGRDIELSDAAGIAVSLARGAEDPAVQLRAGVRWRRHLAAGGHPDDLRVASALDTIGVVPVLSSETGVLVARAWA